ncbi:MAG: acyl carrier protein [Alphaproteobacteria bacterium]|nr:acyl carrier protein [Alphaproteobacteria bacterium]
MSKAKKEDIRAELVEIFSTVLEIDPSEVNEALSPDNCENWDSLRHMQLCTAIDESFGIALSMKKQIEILNFDLAIETVLEEVCGKG